MKKLFIFIFILIISVIAHETAALKNYKVALGVIVLIATVGTAYQMTLAPIFWFFGKLKNKQDSKKSENIDKKELVYDNAQEKNFNDSKENKHMETNKTKNCAESTLDHNEPLDGDLDKITTARIPDNQALSDPICANDGVVEGGPSIIINRVKQELECSGGKTIFISEDVSKKIRENLMQELVKSAAILVTIKKSDTLKQFIRPLLKLGDCSTVILDGVQNISEDVIDDFFRVLEERIYVESGREEQLKKINLVLVARPGDGFSFAMFQRSQLAITEDGIVEIGTSNEDVSSKNSLMIGYIPDDWVGASDGSKIIMAGDTDHSKTVEYLYEITDGPWKNITTSNLIEGDMDEMLSKLSDESESLSSGKSLIPPFLFENMYEFCLEEAESQESGIILIEEGMNQFANDRKKYNGCFYCYYVSEFDDEITKEIIFIIKK